MKNIIILGCGMVGSAMAVDLSKNHHVTISDINQSTLNRVQEKNKELNMLCIDVTKEIELKNAISTFDLVICSVPGFMGYRTLKYIIEAKKDVVDISFFPEDALGLNELAVKNNVTAIVDCGVAPGMGNIILGHYNEQLKISSFECLVGGLPKSKKWPFNYKAPFSPVDVIQEYTRPARYIENGNLIIRDALSDVELIEFEKVGTLESFNSDGLRSLIFTMPQIPNMKEKTLRYPGHVEYISVLKESGFFDQKPIEINGVTISPIEFTSKILFNDWKLGATEEELTVMKISITGFNTNGKIEEIIYTLYDEYDSDTQTSSMARTTGYTATAAVNLIIENLFIEKGVFPPELVGKHNACLQFVINYLKDRNVIYKKETTIKNE